MAFAINVNSWISVSDANTYFEDIWDGSFWPSLLLIEKERSLVTACKWILSSGYSIAMTSTAQKVKDAQCELAITVYNSYDEFKKRDILFASGVRKFNFNGWAEDLARGELPLKIQVLLESFASGSGAKFFEITRDY